MVRWLKTVILAPSASLLLTPTIVTAQDGAVEIVREDGRVIRDRCLIRANSLGESKGDSVLSKIVATISDDQAFRPLRGAAARW